MTEPKGGTRKQQSVKNGSATVPLSALENVAESFFRQADRKRSKQLGKPFKNRYPRSKEA